METAPQIFQVKTYHPNYLESKKYTNFQKFVCKLIGVIPEQKKTLASASIEFTSPLPGEVLSQISAHLFMCQSRRVFKVTVVYPSDTGYTYEFTPISYEYENSDPIAFIIIVGTNYAEGSNSK